MSTPELDDEIKEEIEFAERHKDREHLESLLGQFSKHAIHGTVAHSELLKLAGRIINRLIDRESVGEILGKRPRGRPMADGSSKVHAAIARAFIMAKQDGATYPQAIQAATTEAHADESTVKRVVRHYASRNPSFRYSK